MRSVPHSNEPRDRRFKLDEHHQLIVSVYNAPFSVVAMRVSNPDCSPITMHG
jgi:hypothetical protein